MLNLLPVCFTTLGIGEPEPPEVANPWRVVAECADAQGQQCMLFDQIRGLEAHPDRKAALLALRKLVQIAATGLPLTHFYDKKQCHELHQFQHLGKTQTIWRIRHGDIRLAFYYGVNRLIFLPLVFSKREDKLTGKQKALLEAHAKPFIDAEVSGHLNLIKVDEVAGSARSSK